MFDLNDIPNSFLRPILSLVLAFLRLLWFLVWNLWIYWIGWAIGWCIFRLLSLGNFPREPFYTDTDLIPWQTELIVSGVGLITLGITLYSITKLLV